MPKLIIECDLDHPGAPNTRVLLDGVPIGVIQHVDFAQSAVTHPHARLHVYDMGTSEGEEVLQRLEACPWLRIVRVDPKTMQPKPTKAKK